jgi:pyruvate formate lyase activating enzyme
MSTHLLRYPTVREAALYEKLPSGKVCCGLCERRCILFPGEKGYCKTRINLDGKLFTLVYGDISAIESRPIEIKPFFHFWPGSTALTFSTWSCNLACAWCQNYYLSKTEPNPAGANFFSPQEIVESAVRAGDSGICVSFQEPTLLFETSIESFKIASGRGLYCCYVSNGYMTLEALKMLKESGLSGLKIDIKGDAETYKKYCGGADVEVVWRNAREAKKMGLHVEIVNLVVTGVNDYEECVSWIVEKHLKEVGAETPLHFTRYYPAYKFRNPPTKINFLEKAYEMAKRAGVIYPYVGNVPGHKYENTYCPKCGEQLIKRLGYSVVDYRVTDDKRCPKCGYSVLIVGEYIRRESPL